MAHQKTKDKIRVGKEKKYSLCTQLNYNKDFIKEYYLQKSKADAKIFFKCITRME